MSIHLKHRGLVVFLCCISLVTNVKAREINLDQVISLHKQNYNISQLFEILITDYSISLSYNSELEEIKTYVSFPKKEYSLKSVLKEIETQCKTIEFIIQDDNIIAKKKKLTKKYTISGFIRGEADGEALIGATVYDKNSSTGTVANEYGFYSLRVSDDNADIRFSYIGYQSIEFGLKITKDTVIDIDMSAHHEIEEVVIRAKNSEILESTQVSKVKFNIKQTETLPQLIGESDILKSIQLLPGVQSGTEGTGGFYVRGGSDGNNLILLDGAPVYNSNHFWGLFSVFNTEALQNVELYKGGFPAQYGGRLSSVLDIRMKEGNNQNFSGSGSMGLISSKILLEGPIIKDKTSFIVTARRSNLDLLANLGDIQTLNFYDINFKINHQFSNRNRLFFSMYKSHDDFNQVIDNSFLGTDSDESTYNYIMGWGNITSTLRWNYVPTNKLFLNTTLTYSSFITDGKGDFKGIINNRYQEKSVKYISNLGNKSASVDLSWYPTNKHTLKFGSKYIMNVYPYKNQERLERDSVLFYDRMYFDTTFLSHEMHAYIQDEIELMPGLKSQIGLHASLYNISNKTFYSIEPRIALRYEISPVWSVKTAFTEMTQYDFQRPGIFELIRTEEGIGISANPEIWLPCTRILLPQKSKQVVLGTYFYINKSYELSIEGFYTRMNNVVDVRKSFVNDIPDVWEEMFQSGKGRAYGAEFLLEKKDGKVKGWLAYTLSKTERQFDNLNNGEYFPYMFDRTHNINFVMNYYAGKKFDIGIVWDYKSGRHITLPDGQYSSAFNLDSPDKNANDLYALSNVNAYRLPAYHRLDIGLNFHKERKRFSRTLSMGVYNAYKNHNSFLILLDYRDPDNTGNTNQEVVKSYALFSIIPYINYTLKF